MQPITFLFLTCVAITATSATLLSSTAMVSFEKFASKYRRSYLPGSKEWEYRERVFNENIERIRQHNSEDHSWRMGVNQFTDKTVDEMQRRRNGYKPAPPGVAKPVRSHQWPEDFVPPQTVDYRRRYPTVLTAVKNQACGDCWAHSAAQSIESAFALQTGSLYDLSQQQIASCTNVSSCSQDGPGGCQGGDPKLGIAQVAAAGGLYDVWTYPYTNGHLGPNGAQRCMLGKNGYPYMLTPPVVTTTGFTAIPTNQEDAVVHALATVGPLGIVVASAAWELYDGGVFSMPSTPTPTSFHLDHAVQLVGYGYDFGVKKHYWIIRNSWSANWGEHGFIRVERFPGKEPCGIDAPHQVVFCNASKVNVTVCGTSGLLADAFYANVEAVSG